MITKKILQISIIFTLLFITQPLFSMDYAHRAIGTSVVVEITGEQAVAGIPVFYTASSEPTYEALPATAIVPYYPKLYYKEYFYRDNESQPIRDFRYYKIKSQPNYVYEKKNVPLRDFRFDYWKNKEYR